MPGYLPQRFAAFAEEHELMVMGHFTRPHEVAVVTEKLLDGVYRPQVFEVL